MGKKDQKNKQRQKLTAVIETPSGSRNKYAWDEKFGGYRLKKVLPAGMVFPYNFGFVPETKADDGDPLDVLVLMDAPAFTGCLIECQLIGAIEAEQTEDGKTERNDRLIAAEINDSSFSNIHDIDELPKPLLKEIEAFFIQYNRVEGKSFKILRMCQWKEAAKLIKKSKIKKSKG
ncbi:MAG TPA: inorganic diphosphatase [Terriglobales bacterium]|nr:inorganic diphosphatase [Terriglobales bacterium]